MLLILIAQLFDLSHQVGTPGYNSISAFSHLDFDLCKYLYFSWGDLGSDLNWWPSACNHHKAYSYVQSISHLLPQLR